MINTSETSKARKIYILQLYFFYEQLKFYTQFNCMKKSFITLVPARGVFQANGKAHVLRLPDKKW